MNALTIRDLSVVAGEPRIHDLVLGQRLGFDRPRNIRKIVENHRAELGTYGAIPLRSGAQFRGSPQDVANRGPGAPQRGFLLNEPQALLVCMFSQTPMAAEVRRQLIEVFMAYRRGELQAAPQPRRAKQLEAPIPVTDMRHPDFRDPLEPVDHRRALVTRLREFDNGRDDAAMVRTLAHVMAPAGPGRRVTWPRFFHDKQVLAAIIRTHRQGGLDRVLEQLQANFGWRAPSRSALGRFWLRLDGVFGTGRKLH